MSIWSYLELCFATKSHEANSGTFDNKSYRIKVKSYGINIQNDLQELLLSTWCWVLHLFNQALWPVNSPSFTFQFYTVIYSTFLYKLVEISDILYNSILLFPSGCLFVLFMVSFAVQKLWSFLRSHLFIFVFISIILGGGSKKNLLWFMSECSAYVFL